MFGPKITADEAFANRIPEDRLSEAHMSWRGQHMSVAYEIVFWGAGSMCDGHGMFNAYLAIPEASCPGDLFDKTFWLEPQESDFLGKGRVGYDYYSLPLEFDSEITYYEKLGGLDGQGSSIKAGCDYGHLWHSERGYPDTLESVERDIKKTIEKLRDQFPDMLWRCSYDHSWHPRADIREAENGRLIAAANVEKCSWFVEKADETAPAIGE